MYLESMCLAQFAIFYVSVPKKAVSKVEFEENTISIGSVHTMTLIGLLMTLVMTPICLLMTPICLLL